MTRWIRAVQINQAWLEQVETPGCDDRPHSDASKHKTRMLAHALDRMIANSGAPDVSSSVSIRLAGSSGALR